MRLELTFTLKWAALPAMLTTSNCFYVITCEIFVKILLPRWDLNPRLPPYQGVALPDRTTRQYNVVLGRLELPTPALSGQCSNQLSYKTILLILVANLYYFCDKIEHVVRFELTIVRFCRPLPLTTRPHVQFTNMSMN